MEIDVRSPFPFEALPRIWRWIEPFREKVSDDFGPQTQEDFVSFAAAKWDTQKTWAIYVDGEMGGLITFERLSPWVGTAHWIFKPNFQGKGIAAKASAVALGEMFATGIGKLAVYPLAGNLAMGSLLIRLGFTREGTLIEQTLCNGKPTDMWVYGLTKSQFEEKQHAMVCSSGRSECGSELHCETQRKEYDGTDDDADHDAGVAGTHEEPDGVLQQFDGEPVRGIGANQKRGDG